MSLSVKQDKRISNKSLRDILIFIMLLVSGFIGGFTVTSVTLSNGEVIDVPKIELASTQTPTLLETEEGKIEIIDAPTVEFVDSELSTACPEDSIECAKGANLPYLDITSPETVLNSVLGQCVDFDGAYGSQCFDLMAYFQYVYTGRWLSANGTGAAYGIWDARDYNNQGGEYELIYDTHDLQAGDWVIFHNGIYGHVGMALGGYNNGYIALLGTNQGGTPCVGGGAVANIINMNLASFSGAFRPKIWEKKPEPTPIVDECKRITLVEGDTLGSIMQRCKGIIDWTSMNDYAKEWVSEYYVEGQTVYNGWYNSNNGVGLYAGDTIQHN